VKIGKVIRDVFTLDVCINRIGQNMALNAPNCNASVEYKHMLGLHLVVSRVRTGQEKLKSRTFQGFSSHVSGNSRTKGLKRRH
jgi:hypothetical protein